MKTRILIAIVLFASSCFAIVTNLNSGATHSAINDAVSAASSGDTLLVSTGNYTYMSINNRNLTILGGYTPDFSAQVSYDDTILDGFSYCALFNHSTSTVEGLTFTGAGYGMQVYNTSVVTCRHCAIEHNTHYSYGAGARVFGHSLLVLEYTDVENNSATNTNGNGDGGGAYVSQGTLIVSEYSHIRYNSAAEKGGGVYISGYAYVEVKDSSFIAANTAAEAGGGVYITGGDLYVHDGGDIGYRLSTPNSVTNGNGGGIYARNASVIFKDYYTALLNSYASENGGGAYLTNSTMTLYNYAHIGEDSYGGTNCAANDGGGIYAIHSTVALTNADVHACRAGRHGGGMYANSSEVILYNCDVGNTNDTYTNISGADGGAIDTDGGNILINKTTFVNNQARDDGGAIRIDDSTLTITNSVLKNNIAADRAGALYVLSGSAVAVISDSSIVTNIAGNDGGGIYWYSDSNLTVRSSIINANEAADDGGGIYATGSALIQLDDVEMLYNKAIDDGGGILAYGGQILRLIDCDIRLNCADSDNNNNGNGGGFAIKGTSNLEIIADKKNTFIGANTAENGAGIYVVNESSTVDIVATSGYKVAMLSNMASGDGGAIHAVDPSEVTAVGDFRISQCNADNGGGISATEGAQVTLAEAEGYQPRIKDCTARESGGGIYAVNVGTRVICDGALIGGVNDGNISQGTGNGYGGGGAAVLNNAEFRAIDCVFEENSSDKHGGAIYVSNATVVVRGDVAGGVPGPLPPTVFKGNTATNSVGYGGAMYIEAPGSVATVWNAACISNRARRGGAIYVNTFAECLLNNVLLAQNFANMGINPGAALRAFNSTVRMAYCTVAHNNNSGVAIHDTANLWMTNCIVWGNGGLQVSTNEYVCYSDVQGGYPTGVGNIDLPPMFADFPSLNYQLTAGSPCTNRAVDIGIPTDCVGTPRPQFGGYDMGAYEFIPEPGMILLILPPLLIVIRLRRR